MQCSSRARQEIIHAACGLGSWDVCVPLGVLVGGRDGCGRSTKLTWACVRAVRGGWVGTGCERGTTGSAATQEERRQNGWATQVAVTYIGMNSKMTTENFALASHKPRARPLLGYRSASFLSLVTPNQCVFGSAWLLVAASTPGCASSAFRTGTHTHPVTLRCLSVCLSNFPLVLFCASVPRWIGEFSPFCLDQVDALHIYA